MQDLLTMQDLRARYGSDGRLASRTYIYNGMVTGHIPQATKLGGKMFWRREDVLAREAELFGSAAQSDSKIAAAARA